MSLWAAIASIAIGAVVAFAAAYGVAMLLTDWEDDEQ